MASCISESHRKLLLEGMQYLWSNDLLFDYTLVAEDESIHVHKVVMAACSDYFRVLLCGEMRDSKENQVVLKDIRASTLRSLVKFAYTGELKLFTENIEEIVSGARYFQMLDALDLCRTFLKQELTEKNAVYILDLAEKYVLYDVQETTEDLLLEKFEKLPKKTFLNLSEKQLMKLLSRDSLRISSKYKLFEMTLSWIEANADVKKETTWEILDQIRYPLMSEKDLFSVSQIKVMTSQRCQDLLKEAHNYHNDVLKQPLMQTERTQVRAADKSYIFATEDGLFCTKRGKYLEKIRRPNDEELWIEHVAVVDNFLYVYFIRDPPLHTSFERYDPRFDVWEKLPSLTVPRTEFNLVQFEKSIYAIGGYEDAIGGHGGKFEVFSIQTNKWEMLSPISCDHEFSAGVLFDGKIYVTGGETYELEEYECLSTVNCYSPATDSWEVKAPMIKARFAHDMAVVSGRLYAFGGMFDDSWYTVEYYSPEVDQWTLTDIHLKVLIFGLIVDKDVKFLTVKERKKPRSANLSLVTYDIETAKTAQKVDMMVDNMEINSSMRVKIMPCTGLVMRYRMI